MAPLKESMKINYFEDGITDSSFNFIKSTVMVDCQEFQEFDAAMQLYVDFKPSQKLEAPTHQACNVSTIQGCRGERQGCGGCGGSGQGSPNAPALGLVPQEEINKATTIKNKYYPTSVYNKFTPAKKAKHWQLRTPWKTPGTGPSGSVIGHGIMAGSISC